MSPDEVVARVAARQHGLITRQQAFDSGLSASAIQHRRRAGRWITVDRGVYLIHGAPFTWHARVLSVCLSTGGNASHRCAAVFHEVRGFRPGPPEITVPQGCVYVREGVRIHESVDLHRVPPMTIEGVPVSTPSRLAVDLGAVVPFPRYEAAIDDLIARELLGWADAMRMLFLHSKQGRNGVGALRALLEERYGSDVAESVLEREFFREFSRRGLAEPEAQVEIEDEQGFIARVDYAYRHLKIAIELDSRRFHLNAEAFEADRRKRNRLRMAGWLVLEYTWDMLMKSAEAVFRQIRKAIADRTPTSAPI